MNRPNGVTDEFILGLLSAVKMAFEDRKEDITEFERVVLKDVKKLIKELKKQI